MPIGVVATVGAAAVGAGATIMASQNAAHAQKQAAQQSIAAQQGMYNQTQQNLAPFVQAGGSAQNQLQALTGSGPGGNPLTAPLTAPFQPTQAQLEGTPGYQFTLGQGLKSVQNSYAAQGLANSGAALKGAGEYATGLAQNTYQQQFQNYLTQNAQIANILQNQVNTGESAAAQQGSIAQATGANIGSNLVGAGNAQAAANIASGQAIAQAPMNGLLTYALANNAGIFGTNSPASGALPWGSGGYANAANPIYMAPELQVP